MAAGPLFDPEAVEAAFARTITSQTDAVICSHVSNVFGFIQPVDAIAALCRSRGIPFVIDASQSAGVLPLDMEALGAAFIAMPGHKGLYGPQGTGVLLCGKDAETATLLEGGTGSMSLQQTMPDFLPDRLEAGTHNMPGIAGLLAGVRFVRSRGESAICRHERLLALAAAEGLRQLPGVCVYARPDLADQTGVISFTVKGREPETLAAALASGTSPCGRGSTAPRWPTRPPVTVDTGTVRACFSHWNTPEEVGRFLSAMREILR